MLIPTFSSNQRKIGTICVLWLCSFFFPAVFAQRIPPHPSLIEVNTPESPDKDIQVAIVGGRLIDGLGNEAVEDAVIIVGGNRIIDAGPASQSKIPEGAEIIDAKGMTVLPGLIDAHLHTINNNSVLNTFLRNGVTTMRDPGHPFRFYQSINFAEEQLPRIFLTGAHLDAYPGVYTQQAVMIKDHDHAREMVKNYVEQGGSGIKIYFRLPLKYYETVLQTAEYYHIPVVAHMELVAADDAIRAGLKGVEHVTSFGTSLADPKDAQEFREGVEKDNSYRSEGRYMLWSKIDLTSERVKKVLELAAQENVSLCPTLATFERQEGDQGVEDYHVAGFKNMLQFVGMAHKAGVKIVTGSHTHGNYAEHGWAYQREMELLVEAGMSPLEVISSSTMDNAAYFRSSERIGSLEPGKLADLIMVEGDPSKDISDMYNIRKVMLNGKWVE
jgi:imidazolonepropionase-like amidohydrolase